VPKLCSQRGIIPICRRNRLARRHTDDAETQEVDHRIARPGQPQNARISASTSRCFDEAVEPVEREASADRFLDTWISREIVFLHPTRPRR
jgi:hypothetical protein